MKGIIRDATANFVGGLAVGLILLILTSTSLMSKFSTDDWFAFLRNTYFIVFMTLLICCLLVFLFKRKRKSAFAYDFIDIGPPAPHGWRILFEECRNNVTWTVRVPKEAYEKYIDLDFTVYEGEVEDIYIKIPPKCPVCGTDLKEKKKILGYEWNCIGCGFRKFSRNNFHSVADDVRILALRKAEKNKEIKKLMDYHKK
ncbi:hypothetical protein [Bhargavaea beijingensis]|uniref:hypothetical protein n=1 Tax=Bhargavaea beijingensis TaxID=426756 RepID=UPI002225636D|nr:hypothetical protein [Bhargavaea beijingensis]MCW1929514.1 hypothetical protein [Bhargavaea beijingensis]